MSLSRTAKSVKLERWEIETLIDALLEKKYAAANKEDYNDADCYKRRVEELRAILAEPLEPTENGN
jgi:hypothetical protein